MQEEGAFLPGSCSVGRLPVCSMESIHGLSSPHSTMPALSMGPDSCRMRGLSITQLLQDTGQQPQLPAASRHPFRQIGSEYLMGDSSSGTASPDSLDNKFPASSRGKTFFQQVLDVAPLRLLCYSESQSCALSSRVWISAWGLWDRDLHWGLCLGRRVVTVLTIHFSYSNYGVFFLF